MEHRNVKSCCFFLQNASSEMFDMILNDLHLIFLIFAVRILISTYFVGQKSCFLWQLFCMVFCSKKSYFRKFSQIFVRPPQCYEVSKCCKIFNMCLTFLWTTGVIGLIWIHNIFKALQKGKERFESQYLFMFGCHNMFWAWGRFYAVA